MNRDLEIAIQAAREGVKTILKYKEKGIKVKQKGFHDWSPMPILPPKKQF
jgi:hypothetical protein